MQTTIRGLGSYTIPKVDVLVSATVRSQPPLAIGRQLARAEHARFVTPSRRRRCPPGFAWPPATSTIDLTDSEHRIYADNRRTQVDMRFAKVVRFGRTRADIGVDLWNLFNTNYATSYEEQCGTVAHGATWPATRGRTRRPSTRRGSCV